MGDDRSCYLHISDSLVGHLLDEADEALGWDLPDDDVKVPAHLLPPYQDEDDESVLPSASHPSYPYGNPHAPQPSSATHPSSSTLPTTRFSPSVSSPSLATTLPNLSLRNLFTITNFGETKERGWHERGLGELLEEGEWAEEEVEGGNGGMGKGGDTQPTGQNAGSHPAVDGDDEEMDAPDDD